MRRRACLGAGATIVTGFLAGCLGDNGGDSSEIEQRVEEFVAAIDEGDEDRVNGMIAREGETDPWRVDQRARMGGIDLAVERIELLEESGDRATVAVTTSITGQTGFAETEHTEYELRSIDGEWKVWNVTGSDNAP